MNKTTKTCVSLFAMAATLFGSTLTVGAHAEGSTTTYADVSATHQNHVAIDYLSEHGVISGYPDGTFGPDKPINRVEALKIILGAAHVEADATSAAQVKFSDTASTQWYAPFLGKAVAMGIVQGYADGAFKPAQTVNLVEALKMASLAFGYNMSTVQVGASLYADASIGMWYSPYVQFAKDSNFLVATNDYIYPSKPMTRAAFAEMLYRYMYSKDNNMTVFTAPSADVDGTGDAAIDATVRVFNVGTSGMAFTMDGKTNPEIRVKKGETVVINFTSSGSHSWHLDGYDIGTDILTTGQDTSLEFVAEKSGTFAYYCTVGLHRSMGMEGTFIVE